MLSPLILLYAAAAMLFRFSPLFLLMLSYDAMPADAYAPLLS